MKAAGAVGTIGPNLDDVTLSEATIAAAVTNGGASVMTKAAAAKYSTTMVAYKGVLTPAQIANVAAFVYASTHATAPAPTPAPVKVTLTAAGHTPAVGAHWAYTVHTTAGGKPAQAKITVQVVDPTGHAHPVQFGTGKKNVTNWNFKGSFSNFVVWPASSAGIPLTFRVSVLVGKTKHVVGYRVIPKSKPSVEHLTVTIGQPKVTSCTLSKPVVTKGAVVFTVVNKGKTSRFFEIDGKRTRLIPARSSATLTVTFAKTGQYSYTCVAKGSLKVTG